jgi:hypothetical protein
MDIMAFLGEKEGRCKCLKRCPNCINVGWRFEE